jgi:hypothetical protein
MGYLLLYQWMLGLRPGPSPEQLDHAWKRLRRFMFRDLFRRRRFWRSLHARLMRPPVSRT